MTMSDRPCDPVGIPIYEVDPRKNWSETTTIMNDPGRKRP